MNNRKRGFTLIELLAVIIIIGIIVGISTTYIINVANKTKERSYKELENIIKSSAHKYILNTTDILEDVKSTTCSNPIKITFYELVQTQNLSSDKLINPITGKNINYSEDGGSYIDVYYGNAELDNCNNVLDDYDYRYRVNIVDNK